MASMAIVSLTAISAMSSSSPHFSGNSKNNHAFKEAAFKEAMLFLSRIESQFKALTVGSSDSVYGDAYDRNGSSKEEFDGNNSAIDPLAEDREMKGQLLRKYSGYLGSLNSQAGIYEENKEREIA
ncbi:Homeobox protein knotted-1-like let6 [Thalictrum thalictroides]|uniref:Homeobox protein knotted-1-like let6 n=1 Tax=Thalictrum thalictroides TaxID=46969 RepID=A0A7J6VFC9_THATH|nr:Homeobox protein knotted-1-like let6 [Thalictrum thalictroides]